MRSTASAVRPSRIWKIALCSESTGRIATPARLASAMKRSPALTRHSLFASATRAPDLTAASVGASPAAPTIAATTRSTGRAAASATASGPAAHAMPVPASAALSSEYPAVAATTASRAPTLRAISARRAPFALAVTASTTNAPGCSRMTASVLVPIEPVAPRMVIRRGAAASPAWVTAAARLTMRGAPAPDLARAANRWQPRAPQRKRGRPRGP